MKRGTWILTIVLACAWLIFACFITACYIENRDVVESRIYEGRIYLADNDYEQFKQYLADNPDVEIKKLESLSSPNALVDFEFIVPADIVMPYGEAVFTSMKFGGAEYGAVMGMSVFAFILLWWTIYSFITEDE